MSSDKKSTTSLSTDSEAPKESDEELYRRKVSYCSVIAKPMASRKLANKCYKLIKKAIRYKTYICTGLKNVQNRIRKGDTGIVVFAGDVSPIDVMAHMPIVCEEKSIPYVYIPSRVDLGAALGKNTACLMALVRPNSAYEKDFNKLKENIYALAVAL